MSPRRGEICIRMNIWVEKTWRVISSLKTQDLLEEDCVKDVLCAKGTGSSVAVVLS
jgi:hypothetical protein